MVIGNCSASVSLRVLRDREHGMQLKELEDTPTREGRREGGLGGESKSGCQTTWGNGGGAYQRRRRGMARWWKERWPRSPRPSSEPTAAESASPLWPAPEQLWERPSRWQHPADHIQDRSVVHSTDALLITLDMALLTSVPSRAPMVIPSGDAGASHFCWQAAANRL